MNVILAGMPAAGKTTVAKRLSALTGAKIIDTDEEIVKAYGPIDLIFKTEGEAAFRNYETETVKKVSCLNGAIISTGGGCLIREENVRLLKQNGVIIYLRADINTLLKRANGGAGRPLLFGDTAQKMRSLFTARAPVYSAAADYVIDTDGLSADEVAKKISELKV